MRSPLLLALLSCVPFVGAASAQDQVWCVEATGAEVVPPVNSPALGRAIVRLDTSTNELSWIVVSDGFLGAHVASHFHGPAPAGQKAGIQVQLGSGELMEGQLFLTAPQVADLMAGLWYLNFHTLAFGQGEIRGQVDQTCEIDVLCTGAANSASPGGARLVTAGDLTAANNALTFAAAGLPASQFGYLLVGAGTGQVNPPGSAGTLCLSGAPIGRFVSQVLFSSPEGVMSPFTPDIAALPNPPGGSIMAGDTWGFQLWYRDVGGVSNFTDAIAVTFD